MKKSIIGALCLLLCLSVSVFAEPAPAYRPGDTVTFGHWGGESIEWQVLEDMGDGTYVLLSLKGLDAQPYHAKEEKVTWETCTLRAWLNGTFLETAFTDAERGMIQLSAVENPGNSRFGTPGGNGTEDMVYLLSLEEADRYFGLNTAAEDSEARMSGALICLPSETALRHGAATVSQADVDLVQEEYPYPLLAGACWWLLRSPGEFENEVACVDDDGIIDPFGDSVGSADECVRPVIRVRF